MRRLVIIMIVTLALAAPAGAEVVRAPEALQEAIGMINNGQWGEALDAMDYAAYRVWQVMPFALRTVKLTDKPAGGYGIYNPRGSNVYSAHQDTVLVYIEPVGYRVETPQQGVFKFVVSMDIGLLDKDNKQVWGRENFQSWTVVSRRFNREFYLNISLNIKDVPPGDYFLAMRVNDKVADASQVVRVPLKLVDQPAAGIEQEN